MKLKKLGTAVAVTAALGAGTISQAHADAFAEAMINITNFLFTSGGSTPLVIGADITNLTFTDVLTNNAGLAGSGTSTSQAATNTFQASTDPAQACVGACTKPENTFVIDTPPLPGTSFSRADSLLANQPIVVPGFITGTQSATIAETWINSNTFGGATSDITNNSTFEFTAARNIGTLGFDFDAVAGSEIRLLQCHDFSSCGSGCFGGSGSGRGRGRFGRRCGLGGIVARRTAVDRQYAGGKRQ